MRGTSRLAICAGRISVLLVLVAMGRGQATAQPSDEASARPRGERAGWPFFGGDLANTRSRPSEGRLGPENVHRLAPKWVFRTTGSVSATPSVDADSVYLPDWGGTIFRVDRESGEEIWRRDVSEITGRRFDYARATPALAEDRIVFGDQAGLFRGGARVIALDKTTGDTLWMTEVDAHASAVITQSAVIHEGRVYVGVASLEEAHAGVLPGYPCCSFRGSVLALELATGKILWKTYTAPDVPGFSGNAVWGSTPVVDVARRSLYVTTGNNYTVPSSLADCIDAARRASPDDEAAVGRCLDAVPGNYFDAVLALDLDTGAVKWARRALPFDAWTVSCAFDLVNPENCPIPGGPDHDFGQGPALYSVDDADGRGGRRELLGAGQKSGVYWALDPDTGDVVWATRVGPAGGLGGMMWGSAVDGERVYVANVNSNRERFELVRPSPGSPKVTEGGFWCALDARTGEILWQTADPSRRKTEGAVTVANGVVFAGSMARRSRRATMFALDGETGEILWRFSSGATVDAGPAVVDGTVFWGSGYPPVKGNGGTKDDELYAFTLRGR